MINEMSEQFNMQLIWVREHILGNVKQMKSPDKESGVKTKCGIEISTG